LAYTPDTAAYTPARGVERALRILQILPAGEYGGAESQVLSLCVGLVARGCDVRIVAFANGEFVKRALSAGLTVSVLQGGHPLTDARAVRAQIAKWRPDLIHTHGVRASLAGRSVGKRQAIPVVTTVHSDLYYDYASPLKQTLFMALEAVTRSASTRVIAVSRALLDVLRQRGYAEKQLILIENGMDIEQAERQLAAARLEARPLREELQLPLQAQLIVCVARLHPVKRHDVLLDAFAQLPSSIEEPVHLVLVGEGAEREQIVQRIATYGEAVAKRIHLLGARTDVFAVLQAADVFALTSQMEGLPISVLEAMLAGLPVIASRTGGLIDLVVEQKEAATMQPTGQLFPVGDVQALVEALGSLLGDAKRRQRWGASGRARVVQHYSLEQMTDITLRCYKEIGTADLPVK